MNNMSKKVPDRTTSMEEKPSKLPARTQQEFNERYKEIPDNASRWGNCFSCTCDGRQVRKGLSHTFPISMWVRTYKFREYFLADIITGFTVAMFHIPQALGYTLLASVPTVMALYTAVFPCLAYVIFGTINHLSVGADAVMAMMTGNVVRLLIDEESLERQLKLSDLDTNATFVGPTVSEVTATICVTMAIFQLLFCLFNLGSLSVFLSEHMMNGFATGVAFQIGVSQLPSIFGIKVPAQDGLFVVIKTLYKFSSQISETNIAALIVSLSVIALVFFVKIVLDDRIKRKLGFPFPIELLVVVLFTVVSFALNFSGNYNMKVVGTIPQGLPQVSFPVVRMDIIDGNFLLQAFAMSIVNFSVTLALGRMFSKKHDYEVNANQEFLALGAVQSVASCFGCFPASPSVPRSAIQESAGGKTQLVSVVNSVIIFGMILSVGKYLEYLPVCVLAAIIITSLKNIVFQVQDFKRFWDLSKIDAQIWLVTLLATVILNVSAGILFGVGFSLLTLIYRIQRPKAYLMARVSNTEHFVPQNKFQLVSEIPNIKIFHFGGSLHFANAEYFKYKLFKRLGFSVKDVRKYRARQEKTKSIQDSSSSTENIVDLKLSGSTFSVVCMPDNYEIQLPTLIVFDFSRITWMDGSSTQMLKKLVEDLRSIGIESYIACCSTSLFSFLKTGGAVDVIGEKHFFTSILDAVEIGQERPSSHQ